MSVWVGMWAGRQQTGIWEGGYLSSRTSSKAMEQCPGGQGKDPHQDVQAGSLEKGDLVSNGEGGEAGQLLGKLHSLNDALGGEFTELVPEVNVQRNTLL